MALHFHQHATDGKPAPGPCDEDLCLETKEWENGGTRVEGLKERSEKGKRKRDGVMGEIGRSNKELEIGKEERRRCGGEGEKEGWRRAVLDYNS